MKKIKKSYVGVILALSMLCGLSGCGGSKSADNNAGRAESITAAPAAEAPMAPMDEKEAYAYDSAAQTEEAGGGLASSNSISGTNIQSTQKLIKDIYINAETKEFDSLMEALTTQVTELGGYIQNSQLSGNSYYGDGYKNGSIVARIPADKLDLFVRVVSDAANITSKSESTRDVTLQYVDMASHVSALRAEQESLLKILEAATKLDDIIKVQSQLTQVRYEIESYESQLRTFDNLVSYSTVSINIQEVGRETTVITKTFGEKVSAQLGQNLYDIKEGFLDFSIWFISSLPYIVIWAVIIISGVLVGRGIYRKRQKKAGNHIVEKAEPSETKNE